MGIPGLTKSAAPLKVERRNEFFRDGNLYLDALDFCKRICVPFERSSKREKLHSVFHEDVLVEIIKHELSLLIGNKPRSVYMISARSGLDCRFAVQAAIFETEKSIRQLTMSSAGLKRSWSNSKT